MRRKNRRLYYRLAAYHLVKYRVLSGVEEQPTFVPAAVKDISADGVCLKTNEYLPETTLLELKINFPSFAAPINTMAKVAWIKERGKGIHYEVGLQFVKIEESARKMIDEHIQGVQKTLKKNKGLFGLFSLRKGGER